jgi:hypothetical protein
VLPVVALAFTGLSSGTLTLISELSRIGFVAILSLMTAGVLWLGWKAGSMPARPVFRPAAGPTGDQPMFTPGPSPRDT